MLNANVDSTRIGKPQFFGFYIFLLQLFRESIIGFQSFQTCFGIDEALGFGLLSWPLSLISCKAFEACMRDFFSPLCFIFRFQPVFDGQDEFKS